MSAARYYNVKKFGGESVDMTRDAFVMQNSDRRNTRLAVVSAFSGVTNQLFAIAASHPKTTINLADFNGVIGKSFHLLRQDSLEISQRVERYIVQMLEQTIAIHATCANALIKEDLLIGLGERIAALVVANHWNLLSDSDEFIPVDLANLIDRSSINDHSRNKQMLFAAIESALFARLSPILALGKTPVITGYLGSLPGGIMSHMDRGYSDSTAILVARALVNLGVGENRARVEICKTVSGILSTDPNFLDSIKNPFQAWEDTAMSRPVLRREVGKSVISKAASSGAKVVNAVAAHLLETSPQVDGLVRHTLHPDQPGTIIVDKLSHTEKPGLRLITGKSQRRIMLQNTSALNTKDWLAKIFAATEEAGISVNVVESPDNTCTIWMNDDRRKLDLVTESLEALGTIVESHVVGLITCLEDGKRPIRESNLDMQNIFATLGAVGIDVLDFSAASGATVTITVEGNQMIPAIRALHSNIIVLES